MTGSALPTSEIAQTLAEWSRGDRGICASRSENACGSWRPQRPTEFSTGVEYPFNPRRAELIADAALADTLRQGHVMAAGLDVFEHEPLPSNSPLLYPANAPHISAGTGDAMRQKMTVLFDNLERFFATGWLENQVIVP